MRRGHDEPTPAEGETGEPAAEHAPASAHAPAPPAPTGGADGGPAADPLDSLAGEIASMLRTTKEACRRIEAQAEERAAHTVEEAGAQAEELVAAAEAHAAAQAAEGEAAVAAQRDEAKHLLDEAARSRDEAARDRDAASAALVRSRKLLAAAEHQLAKSIDHAVELRAALEALRSEADAVEGEPATVDASTAQGAGAEQVIDLTEHPVDPPAELDGSLRDAVARAVDEASNPQDPAT